MSVRPGAGFLPTNGEDVERRTALEKDGVEEGDDWHALDNAAFSVLFFDLVVTDFKALYLAQTSREDLRATVRRLRGRVLSLRFPETWYLLVRPRGEIPIIEDANVNGYLCCDDDLEPLGVCVVRTSRSEFRETACVMLMSRYGSFLVYDASSDGMFAVARDLRDLAINGLSRCESVYRDTPLSAMYPEDVVEALVTSSRDPVGLSATAIRFGGRTVDLVDLDNREPLPFKIFGTVSDLRRHPPFAVLRGREFSRVLDFFGRRLCSSWYLLGAVGEYHDCVVFQARCVVVIDASGTVYGFDVEEGDLSRLADDIITFLKMGLAKRRYRNRFDRGLRGELRLETSPDCIHRHVGGRERLELRGRGPSRRDAIEAYDWLVRRGVAATRDLRRHRSNIDVETIRDQLRYPASAIRPRISGSSTLPPNGASPPSFEGDVDERNFRVHKLIRVVRARPTDRGGEEDGDEEIFFDDAFVGGTIRRPFVGEDEDDHVDEGFVAEDVLLRRRLKRLEKIRSENRYWALPDLSRAIDGDLF